MEQVLSEILDKVETIDELWAFVKDEKRKLYIESLWEMK